MKKPNIQNLLILFFIFLSVFVSGAFGIVDSENFELYDTGKNYTDLFTTSSGKWSCVDGATCIKNQCGGGGIADFYIENVNANKFLSMWSFGEGCAGAGYKEVRMTWNHSNTSNIGNAPNKSITLRIRINEFRHSLLGFPNTFAGADTLNPSFTINTNEIYGGSRKAIFGLGRIMSYVPDNFTRLRPYFDFDRMKPEESSCSLGMYYNKWHDVVIQYITNTTHHTEVKIFVDGIECINYEESFLWGITHTFDEIRISTTGAFNMSIDDIKIYDTLINPMDTTQEPMILNCPVGNCIFYDDYTYIQNYNLSQADYYIGTEDFVTTGDGYVWGNASGNIQIMYYDFEESTGDYDIINNLVKFQINATYPTPPQLIDDFVAYRISTLCDTNIPVYTYNIFITLDYDFWNNVNDTLVNIYSVKNSELVTLGTLIVDNGDYFIITNQINKITQTGTLNIIRKIDVLENDLGSLDYKIGLDAQCSNITGFVIHRRDNLESITDFLKIDKIFYYGDYVQTEEGYVYETTNETNINDSLIKTNIDDMLHNASFTLGFRSNGMKMFFWLLIIVGLIMIVVSADVPSTIKPFIIGFILIMGIVIGWYIKFIPTGVFSLIIFIIALVGAIVLQRLFSSSGSTT